jgi:hypothetical protein
MTLMKQLLFPASLTAIIFPLYAFFGDAAFSLLVGLFIGTVAALVFFDLIGFNGAVVISVVAGVFYLLMGDDALYFFSLLAGVFFCLIGLYALLAVIQLPRGAGAVLLLLIIASPVAFSIGGYLVWTGVSELGLLPFFGLEETSPTAWNFVLPPAVREFSG